MKNSMQSKYDMSQQGFTLVELLVTMLVVMVVLGGLIFSFSQQNSEYNYQNKRMDSSQDLEFGINYIVADIRNSLRSQGADILANVATVDGLGATPATVALSFKVWDASNSANNYRSRRCYLYRNNIIYLRRAYPVANVCNGQTSVAVGSGFAPILENVTFFKVFTDTNGVLPSIGAAVPSGAPVGLSPMTGRDSRNTVVSGIPGYTVLIEMGVDAGYKKGSFLDVTGVDVRATPDRRKRIWRYVQGYPGTVVQ